MPNEFARVAHERTFRSENKLILVAELRTKIMRCRGAGGDIFPVRVTLETLAFDLWRRIESERGEGEKYQMVGNRFSTVREKGGGNDSIWKLQYIRQLFNTILKSPKLMLFFF